MVKTIRMLCNSGAAPVIINYIFFGKCSTFFPVCCAGPKESPAAEEITDSPAATSSLRWEFFFLSAPGAYLTGGDGAPISAHMLCIYRADGACWPTPPLGLIMTGLPSLRERYRLSSFTAF